MDLDPVATNPEHYRVLFENDRVRVLGYADVPGDATTPHDHPDSVMVTLTGFERRRVPPLPSATCRPAGAAVWLPAQRHRGENIGSTPTQVVLVELLKEAPAAGGGATDPGESRPRTGPAAT